MDYVLVRYVHFLGIITLAFMLVAENLLLAKQLKAEVVKKLAIIDGIYGLGAVITLLAGLSLWLWIGKPKEFYSENIIFHFKLGLFFLIAIMSVIPTVFFLRHRNSLNDIINVPSYIIIIKRVEIGLLLILPILAMLMAQGVGL